MRKMLEILFDSCVLSNFAFSDSLFILKGLYGHSAFITDFVSAEIMHGIQHGYSDLKKIQNSLQEGWIREIALSTITEKGLFQVLSVSLGLGEASSIAVAKARGFLFACDDKAARREAGLLEVKLTGTIGMLKKAVKTKIVSKKHANIVLAGMRACGFYSPVESL